LAITDGLTGLYNYRHFRDRLDQEFERAKRYKLPLSCLIFDVDDFKKFNDTHGHLVGDSILREIAGRTLLCIRNSDFVARYGGEEFVIILPQTSARGALSEAERLLAAMRSKSFDAVEGVRVTVSVGVGTFDGTMSDSEDILKVADDALYEAKKAGKDCVYSYA
jgi:two-component system cell cycle response regulator